MEVAALCALVFAIGLLIGFEWGSKRRERDTAPIPSNPDTGIQRDTQRGETVMICGYPMTRM